MNKQLISALKGMSELEFLQLEKRINLANLIRGTMTEYKVGDAYMAAHLEVSLKTLKIMKVAAYDFDLRFISKLEVLRRELYIQRAKDEGKFDVITFPPYKYSRPITKEDIDKDKK